MKLIRASSRRKRREFITSLPFNSAVHCNNQAITNHRTQQQPLKQPSLRGRRVKCLVAVLLVATCCLVTLATYKLGLSEHTGYHPEDVSTSTTLEPHPKHYVIKRSTWGGRYAKRALPPLNHPVSTVIIDRTDADTCKSVTDCFQMMQNLLYRDLELYEFPDIRYNFVIGGDGNVYDGRGWYFRPQEGTNDSISVAISGYFSEGEPSGFMWSAVTWLIAVGRESGSVSCEDLRVISNLGIGVDYEIFTNIDKL